MLSQIVRAQIIFFLFIPLSEAFAADSSSSKVDAALHAKNYLAARRLLSETISKPRPKKESEGREWTIALLALVDLERMVGDQDKAKGFFKRCDRTCPQVAGPEAWGALKKWACRDGFKANACALGQK